MPSDGLAPAGAKALSGAVMNTFLFHVYMGLNLKDY